ncbi:MAG: hypothetical protein ACI3Z8_07000 [Paludibacteraceae bacterium]
METALNAAFLHDLSVVAEDEQMMKKVSAYVRRLLAAKEDETAMTKEEFFRRIDEAEKGKTYTMRSDETLDEMLKRVAL